MFSHANNTSVSDTFALDTAHSVLDTLCRATQLMRIAKSDHFSEFQNCDFKHVLQCQTPSCQLRETNVTMQPLLFDAPKINHKATALEKSSILGKSL